MNFWSSFARLMNDFVPIIINNNNNSMQGNRSHCL